MSWPQIFMIGFVGISFLTVLSKHGEPREDYHAGWAIADVLAIWIILDQGGFWG